MESMASMTKSMPATTTASSAMSTTTSSGMSGMGDMHMGSSCHISMLWNWNTIDACFLSSSWHIRSRSMFTGSCIGVVCLVLCLEFLRRVGREYDAFIVRRGRLRKLYLSGPAVSRTSPPKQPHTMDRVSSSKAKVHEQSYGHDLNSSSSSSAIKDDIVSPVLALGQSLDRTAPAAPCPHSTTTKMNGLAYSTAPDSVAQDQYRPSPVEQMVRALLHMLQFAVAYFIMLLAMYFNGYIIICIFIGAFLGSLIFSWEPVSLNRENDATQVTKCCG